jgi:hypothetical protein
MDQNKLVKGVLTDGSEWWFYELHPESTKGIFSESLDAVAVWDQNDLRGIKKLVTTPQPSQTNQRSTQKKAR